MGLGFKRERAACRSRRKRCSSTLMNILAGVFAPDEGQLLVDARIIFPDPMAARRAGVQIVHQEPQLCDHLTIEQNMVLGAEPTRRGYSTGVGRQQARSALSFFGSDAARAICLDAPVSDVGPGTRQIGDCARYREQRLPRSHLDEPTSSLVEPGRTTFSSLRRLKRRPLHPLHLTFSKMSCGSLTITRSCVTARVCGGRLKMPPSMIGFGPWWEGTSTICTWSERDALEPIVELDNVWTHRGGRRRSPTGAAKSSYCRTRWLRTYRIARGDLRIEQHRSGRVKVAGMAGPLRRRLAQGVGMLVRTDKGRACASR